MSRPSIATAPAGTTVAAASIVTTIALVMRSVTWRGAVCAASNPVPVRRARTRTSMNWRLYLTPGSEDPGATGDDRSATDDDPSATGDDPSATSDDPSGTSEDAGATVLLRTPLSYSVGRASTPRGAPGGA